MDAAGSERALQFGAGDAGPLSALLAATYPERTVALVLFNSAPRFVRSPNLPLLPTQAEQERQLEEILRRWGEPAFHEERMKRFNPSATAAERQSTGRLFRLSVSPGAAADYYRMFLDVDVREVLPSIHVPTLVVYRGDLALASIKSAGQYMAERIPGARLVELPGGDVGTGFGDTDQLFAELEAFLIEVVEEKRWQTEPDRLLATAELGDRAWRELLQNHHADIRRQLSRFRGKEMDTAGDGFFATFDGPARAIHCGLAVRESLAELGLEIRAGLHTGECELLDEKVGGIAVHIGARVASQARPGEVLVSSTVRDLVAGSGIEFKERGIVTLKGVPDQWRLYAVS